MVSNTRDYPRKDNLPSGVYLKGRGYACFVCSKGDKRYLGTFNTLQEAVEIRNLELDKLKVTTKCKFCGVSFRKYQTKEVFCSRSCSGKYAYYEDENRTMTQYQHISNNWSSYFNRLVARCDRRSQGLTTELLIEKLISQDYRCAISGLPLTCQLQKGVKCWSNASIDRINAGGPYSIDNIQLVCRSVNVWRSDMDLDLFINVCRSVTEYQQGLKLSG